METPQRFEGSSIEEVLRRVRAELGNDAEIVEANKVRSGGIGGFFSKERFEVMAMPVPGGGPSGQAVPSRAVSRGRPVGPLLNPPLSLMDMADRVSAAESDASSDTTAPLPVIDTSSPVRRTRAQQVAEEVMVEHLRRFGSETSTQPDPGGFEPFRPAEMPRISTEGIAFTEVLHRIASDAGHEIAEALGRPVTDSAHDVTTPSAAVLTPPWTAPTGEVGAPHAMMHNASDAQHRPIEDARYTQISEDTEHSPFALQAHVASEDEHTIEAFAPTDIIDIDDAAATASAAPADILPVPRPSVIAQAQSRTERLLSWLELDHLPRTTLLSALRSLPQMESLPMTNGVVVAVVGERARALRLCRQLARACDSDPRGVVLASASYRGSAIPQDQRIIDMTDAARDRRGWRRRGTPTFVAVETSTSLDPQSQSWTRGVVEALDAHQVIGVVQAARKAEDIRAWADVIGGVDGLALQELTETTTPYAVLALEIPVAFLADQPATPGSWAQLLIERSAA